MEDNRKKRTKAPDRPLTPKKLKLLVTVVNKNKAEFYVDFLPFLKHSMEANIIDANVVMPSNML